MQTRINPFDFSDILEQARTILDELKSVREDIEKLNEKLRDSIFYADIARIEFERRWESEIRRADRAYQIVVDRQAEARYKVLLEKNKADLNVV